jgi:hypothetical protein
VPLSLLLLAKEVGKSLRLLAKEVGNLFPSVLPLVWMLAKREEQYPPTFLLVATRVILDAMLVLPVWLFPKVPS